MPEELDVVFEAALQKASNFLSERGFNRELRQEQKSSVKQLFTGGDLLAVPSFPPHPLPAYSRHFSRGPCSETARKRLLRRLGHLLFTFYFFSHPLLLLLRIIFL